jgi:hypothetical protein
VAISFVGASTGVTSASLPSGWQAGDLAIVLAYRDGSTTAPSLPSGWTNIISGGANTNSQRVGYRVLQAGDTGTGTWTNATSVVCLVYRGQHATTPIGASAQTGASSTTVTYPALTLEVTDGTSWVVGLAGHRSIDTALETPPTGMVNRANVVDSTDEASGHDTNGGVTSWSATSVSVGGTSSGWRAATVEVRAAPTIITEPLAGTVTATATASGSVVRMRLASATAAGSATASLAAQRVRGVVGTAAGTATATGAARATYRLARTIAAASTASGGLGATLRLASTTAGVASASGTVVRGRLFAATAAGLATASGLATRVRRFAATTAATSSATATAIRQRLVAATTAAASTASGTLTLVGSGVIALAGTISATAAASATAVRTRLVGATSAATSSASGLAQRVRWVAATAAATATTSGVLGRLRRIGATVTAVSGAVGTLASDLIVIARPVVQRFRAGIIRGPRP